LCHPIRKLGLSHKAGLSFLGSRTELKYILRGFGIPASLLPVTSEGKVLSDYDKEKWSKRRIEERRRGAQILPISNMQYRVTTPGNHDILLGRGGLSQGHPGNVRFRYLIDEHQMLYDEALKRDKTALAAQIVGLVHSWNGRFLKDDGPGWVEVDDAVARTKVSTCFRTTRHRKKRTREIPMGIEYC
jgi:hypothetical protein